MSERSTGDKETKNPWFSCGFSSTRNDRGIQKRQVIMDFFVIRDKRRNEVRRDDGISEIGDSSSLQNSIVDNFILFFFLFYLIGVDGPSPL